MEKTQPWPNEHKMIVIVVWPELVYIRKSQWVGNRQNSLHWCILKVFLELKQESENTQLLFKICSVVWTIVYLFIMNPCHQLDLLEIMP